jgi:hypothetical protein
VLLVLDCFALLATTLTGGVAPDASPSPIVAALPC